MEIDCSGIAEEYRLKQKRLKFIAIKRSKMVNKRYKRKRLQKQSRRVNRK